LLKRYVIEQRIAGAVAAVARHGRVGYLQAVGFQDLQTRAPMTERSLFRIYSMTKSVTAVAAMMLQEEGRFSLGDPVAKYLPEFERVSVFETPDGPTRRPSRAMTIEDLLLRPASATALTCINGRRSAAIRCTLSRQSSSACRRWIHRGSLRQEATTVVGRLVNPASRSMRFSTSVSSAAAAWPTWVLGARPARAADACMRQRAASPDRNEAVPFTERSALIEARPPRSRPSSPPALRTMLLNRRDADGAHPGCANTVDDGDQRPA
jgi:hypothetical protein